MLQSVKNHVYPAKKMQSVYEENKLCKEYRFIMRKKFRTEKKWRQMLHKHRDTVLKQIAKEFHLIINLIETV